MIIAAIVLLTGVPKSGESHGDAKSPIGNRFGEPERRKLDLPSFVYSSIRLFAALRSENGAGGGGGGGASAASGRG